MTSQQATVTKWVSIAVMAISIMLLVRALPTGELQKALETWIEGLGVWGPVVFALIYIVATICLVPGSILTLAAGAIFGLALGFATVLVGANIGAALAFLISRYLARSKIESMAQSNETFGAVDEAISEGGWKIVALLRLSPAIPFNWQNYLYGLTDIKFWPYVLTSIVAMAPGTFMYVYLGHVAGLAAGSGGKTTTGQWVLIVVGLLATIAVTYYITHLAKQKLDEKTEVTDAADDGTDDRSTADAGTADSEGDTEQSETAGTDDADADTSATGAYGYAIAAAVLLVIAIAAQFQSDKIAGVIKPLVAGGPPKVTLKESYEPKPDGPTFDHSSFDAILKQHVEPGGWVDYEALRAEPEALENYIESLGQARINEMGRDERLALLMNAYNAFTLKLIIDHSPLDSIKDIPAEQRWEAKRWNLAGQKVSLGQIEHEQIRPHFVEPRIHFAVVCAAIGCPPLSTDAYRGDAIDAQLDRQSKYVHTHQTWLQIPDDGGPVRLTALYDWYGSDFQQVADTIFEFAAHFSPPLQALLDSGSKPEATFLEYDWKLNSVQNAQPR